MEDILNGISGEFSEGIQGRFYKEDLKLISGLISKKNSGPKEAINVLKESLEEYL